MFSSYCFDLGYRPLTVYIVSHCVALCNTMQYKNMNKYYPINIAICTNESMVARNSKRWEG
nr:MAG TPA: hypothetical protein [Caudoviricetes sp.]